MQDSGISPEALWPSSQPAHIDLVDTHCNNGGSEEVDISVKNPGEQCFSKISGDESSHSLGGAKELISPLVADEELVSKKRQKVENACEGSDMALQATTSSLIDWLQCHKDGVSVVKNSCNGREPNSLLYFVGYIVGKIMNFVYSTTGPTI